MVDSPLWERSDLWDHVEPPPPGGLLVDGQLRQLVDLVFRSDEGRTVQIAEASIDLHIRTAEKFTEQPDEKVIFGQADPPLIRPGEILRVRTWEQFKVPPDMAGQVSPKARGLVAGLLLPTTQIDPGFRGPLLLLLINAGPRTVQLTPDFALAKAEFRRLGRAADRPWMEQPKSRMEWGYEEEPETLFVSEPAAAPAVESPPLPAAPTDRRFRRLVGTALIAQTAAIVALAVEALFGWGDVVEAIGDIDAKELGYGIAASLIAALLLWLIGRAWRRSRTP